MWKIARHLAALDWCTGPIYVCDFDLLACDTVQARVSLDADNCIISVTFFAAGSFMQQASFCFFRWHHAPDDKKWLCSVGDTSVRCRV